MIRIAAIGECLVELTGPRGSDVTLGFAGDVYNTAVYLKRLGGDDTEVHFITALGDDWLSDLQLTAMRAAGLDIDAMRVPDASPALYFVRTDAAGERSFTYYREASPVRKMLTDAWDNALTDNLYTYDLVFFSAVTLQMLDDNAKAALLHTLRDARRRGTLVAFDTNYRPRGWGSASDARRAISQALSVTDIALPSMDDELLLYPGSTHGDILDRYAAAGVTEVVLKNGSAPVHTQQAGLVSLHPTPPAPVVVDTTGAGDSFDAGYLGARLQGMTSADSVRRGQQVAVTVLAAAGAIVPISVI